MVSGGESQETIPQPSGMRPKMPRHQEKQESGTESQKEHG